MNQVREELIERDKEARSSGNIDESGCTCGDEIDKYHNDVFEDAAIKGRSSDQGVRVVGSSEWVHAAR